jgi:hypothetical protein
MVETDRPKSLAIFLRGMLFFSRQLRNAVAKLVRMSQWNFDFGATTAGYAGRAAEGKV